MPSGGFGNLIALPLQHRPREQGKSIFLNDNFKPYEDQWAFVASIKRMTPLEVKSFIDEASRNGRILGVQLVFDEEDREPWTTPSSRRRKELPLAGSLPESINVVLGNHRPIRVSDC